MTQDCDVIKFADKNAVHVNDGGRITLSAVLLVGCLLVLPALALHRRVDFRWAGAYVVVMGAISYWAYALDKERAREQRWRISENLLHLMEVLGGWPGAFLAQRRLRHKISKLSFQIVFWIIVLGYQFAAYDSLQNWQISRAAWNYLGATVKRTEAPPLKTGTTSGAKMRGFERSRQICQVAQFNTALYAVLTFVKPLTSHTVKLNDEQAAALQGYMQERNFKQRQVPYARFSGEKDDVNVTFYESGKLVVQGKGTRDFIEFVLEPEILKEVRLGYETMLNPELLLPRIGVDESGKGDFFGPLCIAGVYVNEAVVNAWKESGIRDSKNISSDKKIGELAELIRKTPGCLCTVVPIGNEAYNRLYAKMQSVNTLLAWGHARVIENLMGLKDRMQPPPVRAISDQFAHNKNTVAKALMPLGRQIELIQRHRAEEDLSVAAASILARDEFVHRLARLETEYEMKFPKGASAAVDAAAKEFIQKHGAENLSKVAKMHFRTALRAQGLPEPPRTEWQRR